MSTHITSDEAVRRFAASEKSPANVFVAVMYWCEDAWAIASGPDRAKVEAAAERYMEMWPCKVGSDGNYINGHGAEGYWIMEVPVV